MRGLLHSARAVNASRWARKKGARRNTFELRKRSGKTPDTMVRFSRA